MNGLYCTGELQVVRVESFVLQVTLMSEFDKVVTVPVFGYSSLDAYYADATTNNKVDRIKHPLVCVTAANDAICT